MDLIKLSSELGIRRWSITTNTLTRDKLVSLYTSSGLVGPNDLTYPDMVCILIQFASDYDLDFKDYLSEVLSH